jgi:hypothetical protein
VDTESREAVEMVCTELVRRDELRGTPEGDVNEIKMGVTEQIIAWLAHEIELFSKRPRCARNFGTVQLTQALVGSAHILRPIC